MDKIYKLLVRLIVKFRNAYLSISSTFRWIIYFLIILLINQKTNYEADTLIPIFLVLEYLMITKQLAGIEYEDTVAAFYPGHDPDPDQAYPAWVAPVGIVVFSILIAFFEALLFAVLIIAIPAAILFVINYLSDIAKQDAEIKKILFTESQLIVYEEEKEEVFFDLSTLRYSSEEATLFLVPSLSSEELYEIDLNRFRSSDRQGILQLLESKTPK